VRESGEGVVDPDDHDPSRPGQARQAPDPALSFVLVDLPPELLLPRDGHPNARGAKKIADAVEAELCQLPDAGAYCLWAATRPTDT
jgi:hypothetical protein